jgi:hypothetical protein
MEPDAKVICMLRDLSLAGLRELLPDATSRVNARIILHARYLNGFLSANEIIAAWENDTD